jgi:hypothetical protein
LKTLLGVCTDRPWSLRLGDALAGRTPIKPRKPLSEVVTQVMKETEQYTAKLQSVRVHHELTRCELEDYEHYLKQIMGGTLAAAAVTAAVNELDMEAS